MLDQDRLRRVALWLVVAGVGPVSAFLILYWRYIRQYEWVAWLGWSAILLWVAALVYTYRANRLSRQRRRAQPEDPDRVGAGWPSSDNN